MCVNNVRLDGFSIYAGKIVKSTTVIDWATAVLQQRDIVVLQCRDVVHTAYSHVVELTSDHGQFFLKYVPRALYCEASMLKFLSGQGVTLIPELVEANDDLSAFIMRSCGDGTLRQLYEKSVYLHAVCEGVQHYAAMQSQLAYASYALLARGLADDWRMDKFTHHYQQLLNQQQLLLDEGLSQAEIATLKRLIERCQQLCDQLLALGMPETLCHIDFHDNNMLLDQVSGRVAIIDWGECAVSQPLLSLAGFLWNLSYFHGLNESSDLMQSLKHAYYQVWLADVDQLTLHKAFDAAQQLLGVYAALGYWRLYQATAELPQGVQQTHGGSIAGCLRSFIKVTA